MSAELGRLNITVPVRLLEKLEKARAALSHSHPGATEQEILEAGLDLLLDRHEKCAARKEYGDAWMDGFTRGARVGSPVEHQVPGSRSSCRGFAAARSAR